MRSHAISKVRVVLSAAFVCAFALHSLASAQGFTVFDPPNSSNTYALSINAGGDVTGSFQDASQFNNIRGFIRDRNGNVTTFDCPNPTNAVGTQPQSINAGGDVAGVCSHANQSNNSSGFVRDRQGNFTFFDPPNSSGIRALSINAGGTWHCRWVVRRR
jgi:hypothetical protein